MTYSREPTALLMASSQLRTTMAWMSLIGMGLAGALADLVGVVFVLDIAGGLYLVSGVVAWIIVKRGGNP